MLAISGGIEEIGSVRWDVLICLMVMWVICYFCIWKGVKSTGKVPGKKVWWFGDVVVPCTEATPCSQVVYFTATLPYVMLLVLLIRGLTLPGAMEGVLYYLLPEVSRLADPQVGAPPGFQTVQPNSTLLRPSRFGWRLHLRSSFRTAWVWAA